MDSTNCQSDKAGLVSRLQEKSWLFLGRSSAGSEKKAQSLDLTDVNPFSNTGDFQLATQN